jgi:L-ascorbate metabolism protein UlaG (beta-lactamase superfamily)
MEVTKYEHACMTVEKDGEFLIIDPGGFTADFISPEHVTALVITHEHGDHFDHEQIAAVMDKNPGALIIGPESVVSQIEVFETRAVTGGDSVSVGGFDLTLFGHEHALIHQSIPVIENIGVMINDLLYYPGDSLTVPDSEVTVLALPISAPWLKLGEAIDFLQKIAPRQAFPVHEMVYSAQGQEMAHRMLGKAAETTQTEYTVLHPGESLTV